MIPEILISDNGSQFLSREFKDFASVWGLSRVASSPLYPQSSGEAERAVRTLNHLVGQKDVSLALLTFKAAPVPSLDASPAELAFGRNVRN